MLTYNKSVFNFRHFLSNNYFFLWDDLTWLVNPNPILIRNSASHDLLERIWLWPTLSESPIRWLGRLAAELRFRFVDVSRESIRWTWTNRETPGIGRIRELTPLGSVIQKKQKQIMKKLKIQL